MTTHQLSTGVSVSVEPRRVARRGVILAAGAIAMASTFYIYPDQQGGTAGRVGDVGGLAFQAGLFALWLTYKQTAATGSGRLGRWLLYVVLSLLVLATAWSVLHLVLPNDYADEWWMLVLDAAWPLSMLGFLACGIAVAVVGRWRGLLRWAPLVAESWAPLSMALIALAPTVISNFMTPTLMIVLYGGLGLLLVTRSELVGPRGSSTGS